MRIALADDSLLIRQGLVSLLAADGFEVIASVSSAGALIDAIRIDAPDVCIVDIRMPPTFTDEGIAAAAAIRSEFPGVGVLVLSHHIEPSYAMRLISDYPARTGYLLKERLTDGAILRDSLQRIADGETVIDPTIVAALMNRTRAADPTRRPHRAGADGARAGRGGSDESGDRRAPLDHRADRGIARVEDLREAADRR